MFFKNCTLRGPGCPTRDRRQRKKTKKSLSHPSVETVKWRRTPGDQVPKWRRHSHLTTSVSGEKERKHEYQLGFRCFPKMTEPVVKGKDSAQIYSSDIVDNLLGSGSLSLKGSTRLGYTGLSGGLEHLKIETRPQFLFYYESRKRDLKTRLTYKVLRLCSK